MVEERLDLGVGGEEVGETDGGVVGGDLEGGEEGGDVVGLHDCG